MRIMKLLRAAGYIKFLLVEHERTPQLPTASVLETVTPRAVQNVPAPVKLIAPVASEVAPLEIGRRRSNRPA
jgi:hypothetical protein